MTGPTSRTITFRGELDLFSVRGVTGPLSEAVGDMSCDVAVDLREVTFIDSTALGAFLHAAQQLRNQGRRLRVLITPGPVQELLQHSHVTELFELDLSAPATG